MLYNILETVRESKVTDSCEVFRAAPVLQPCFRSPSLPPLPALPCLPDGRVSMLKSVATTPRTDDLAPGTFAPPATSLTFASGLLVSPASQLAVSVDISSGQPLCLALPRPPWICSPFPFLLLRRARCWAPRFDVSVDVSSGQPSCLALPRPLWFCSSFPFSVMSSASL
jgi:hypothetical protein